MTIERLVELRVSDEIRLDANQLQQRLEDDGYLFFKRLLDPDRLLELRRRMLTVMQAGGWLIPGTDPLDGIADPEARSTEGDPEYTDVYHQVYRLEEFHTIAHSHDVLDLLERIATWGAVRRHLLSIAVGLGSIVLAVAVPQHPAWSGMIYFLMGPVQGISGYLTGKELERAMEAGTEDEET